MDVLIVKISLEHDLPLGDVACQVGNGMGDVVVRHGKHGHELDGARFTVCAPASLLDRSQIAVEISRGAFPRGQR